MEEHPKKKILHQWHPAFFAGIQIELKHDAPNLIFENEHQLGTKPKEIDVLIIKKDKKLPVQKNIGRIFRQHNIVEYKSPSDYLSVDDFYKVYGYACFYKADTRRQNEISIHEITLTFVCKSYPARLEAHLREERNYEIRKIEPGIYYILGDVLPIQIIWTEELPFSQNTWLKSLNTQSLTATQAKELIELYGEHKQDTLYKSVMDMIVNTNKENFLEVKEMCEALEELMKDELAEMRARGLEEGRRVGHEKGREEGRKVGREEGREEGRKEGREEGRKVGREEERTESLRFETLSRVLILEDQTASLLKAIDDQAYRNELFEKYQIL